MLLHLGRKAVHIRPFLVVPIAIQPDFVDISMELICRGVLVAFEVLFHCGEVHWLLYYFRVVEDIQFDWIHGLKER